MKVTLNSPGAARNRLFNKVKLLVGGLEYSHTIIDYSVSPSTIEFSLDEKLTEVKVTEGNISSVDIVNIIGRKAFRLLIYNYILHGNNHAIYEVNSVKEMVNAFTWSHTEEGHSYWGEIYGLLIDNDL